MHLIVLAASPKTFAASARRDIPLPLARGFYTQNPPLVVQNLNFRKVIMRELHRITHLSNRQTEVAIVGRGEPRILSSC